MTFHSGSAVRALLLLGLGAAAGAAGGVAVYKKLHPPSGTHADGGGPPESRTSAPPMLAPDGDHDQKPTAGESPEPQEVATGTVPDPVTVNSTVVGDSLPPEVVAAKAPGGAAGKAAAVVDFFGVPVGEAAVAADTGSHAGSVRLRLMDNRCVAGFDAKSSVLDFTGWTKALSGELTYKPNRPIETVQGTVTADPNTLDTGDDERDKELREKHLETAKYPVMKFEIASVKQTGGDTADMTGLMEFHGVKKELTIPCSFKLRLDGYAYASGEIKVKMTDFGIEPPVKMGVIKVADEIRIWFELWAEPVKELKK